jgi:hypothetical protein
VIVPTRDSGEDLMAAPEIRAYGARVARRVFFSFDFDGDAGRADRIRGSGALAEANMEGFFRPAEFDEAMKQGSEATQRLMQKHLQNTSVTVVLIGAESAKLTWVRYAINQSIEQKNGLLGIYIGHLRDERGRTPMQGLKPMVPAGVEFPAYSWDGDPDRFMGQIAAAGKRSDAWRARDRFLRSRVMPDWPPRPDRPGI